MDSRVLKLSLRPHLQGSRILEVRITKATELPYQESQLARVYKQNVLGRANLVPRGPFCHALEFGTPGQA